MIYINCFDVSEVTIEQYDKCYRMASEERRKRGYEKMRTKRIKEKRIEEYIKNQLQEDIMNDQISMKEYYDPFTGEKYFGGK